MQSNHDLHSIGSYPCSFRSYLSSIRSYFHSIRSYFHSIGSYLSSIRSYFNYFVASYMTLVYSSVVFHIYPYLRGNSIPSDRNYRSAVVTIWSAVKRGRLNLDLVLLWRHTTYDYMTYNWKSSRTKANISPRLNWIVGVVSSSHLARTHTSCVHVSSGWNLSGT